MTKLEELMIYISIRDRLGFLKFRQNYVKSYGSDKFTLLLKQAEKELQNETKYTKKQNNTH